eukprot:Gb_40189 [translate_table: standard]
MESNIPSTASALGLFGLYTEDIPMPMAMPVGVVIAKKHAIIAADKDLNPACEIQPPSAKPSKNWWKDKAAIRGLIVHGLCETPSESPMIIEWDTIPNSRT